MEIIITLEESISESEAEDSIIWLESFPWCKKAEIVTGCRKKQCGREKCEGEN